MIDPSSPADQSNNSISINATGVYSAPPENGIIIKPIRDASGEAQANKAAVSVLGYTTPSGEIIQYRPFDGFGSSSGGSFPVGTIMPYADVSDNIIFQANPGILNEPLGAPGWLWCNGQNLGNVLKYQDLSGVLKGAYGGAWGTLPDLRGRNIFGAGTAASGLNTSTMTGTLGETVGSKSIDLRTFPIHAHNIPDHTHQITPHVHILGKGSDGISSADFGYLRYWTGWDGTGTRGWQWCGDPEPTGPFSAGPMTTEAGPANADWNPTWYSIFGSSPQNDFDVDQDSHAPYPNNVHTDAAGDMPTPPAGEQYIPMSMFLNFIIKY
jgi:hypothetical protein